MTVLATKPKGNFLSLEYLFPPIPIRIFDWSCVDDNYDGAPDAGWQPHGVGETAFAAVRDYYDGHEDFKGTIPCLHRPGFLEDL